MVPVRAGREMQRRVTGTGKTGTGTGIVDGRVGRGGQYVSAPEGREPVRLREILCGRLSTALSEVAAVRDLVWSARCAAVGRSVATRRVPDAACHGRRGFGASRATTAGAQARNASRRGARGGGYRE